MMTGLVFEINLPDWLLCWPFWGGLVLGVVLTICFLLYLLRNFSVFR